jgi:hypothetical protein
MTQNDDRERQVPDAEYPDAAGYPDGTGTLDEGTAADKAEETGDEVADFAIADEEDVDN